ncbi:hypothetical protein BC829DRAFT_92990 [Chytridium lagenaria]|nr:hypothetical protein BC829DRAFT_92990 [Chytridium lagenaria]
MVELAPFQKIPKPKKKADPRVNTIDTDPEYLAFLESLNAPAEEKVFEPSPAAIVDKPKSTPLLDDLRAKKAQAKSDREQSKRQPPPPRSQPPTPIRGVADRPSSAASVRSKEKDRSSTSSSGGKRRSGPSQRNSAAYELLREAAREAAERKEQLRKEQEKKDAATPPPAPVSVAATKKDENAAKSVKLASGREQPRQPAEKEYRNFAPMVFVDPLEPSSSGSKNNQPTSTIDNSQRKNGGGGGGGGASGSGSGGGSNGGGGGRRKKLSFRPWEGFCSTQTYLIPCNPAQARPPTPQRKGGEAAKGEANGGENGGRRSVKKKASYAGPKDTSSTTAPSGGAYVPSIVIMKKDGTVKSSGTS